MALRVEDVLKDSHQTFGLQLNWFFIDSKHSTNKKRIFTMKKRILALACTAALLGFSSEAQAVAPQPLSNSASATASATIIAPVSITNADASGVVKSLAFGTIVPSALQGSVVVATNGGRTGTDVTLLTNSATPVSAAAFTIAGLPSTACTIGLPTSTSLTGPGTAIMTVDTFTSNLGPIITLDGAGQKTFNVGGILTVGASQAAGSYTGTFSVSVVYN